MGTKDSVQRIVENIEITIAPGKENLPSDPTPTLSSWIFFSYPTGKVRIVVDPSKIQVHSGEDVWSPNIVDSFDRDSRRIDGTYNWMGVELKYPAPSGLKDQITFSFQMGALLIDGRAVSIPPFRFTRATKKDVYYGSINC